MSDSEDDSNPEVLIKVILCGDAGVGKTCLIERMFSNKFELTLPSTIGTDQRFKRLKVDGVHIGVSVWDTAGQDRFQSLTPMYFRGAHGVVYVFDVTQPETLDSLANKWMDDFRQHSTHPEAVQMVVGNKIDLAADARAVTSDQGAAFARAHGCLYKETSAKEDCGGVEEGVYDALFWGMVATIIDTPGLVGHGSRRGNGQLDLAGGRSGVGGARRAGCC